MSGVFSSKKSPVNQTSARVAATALGVPEASPASPEVALDTAPAVTPAAGLGAPMQQTPTARIVNRASTMLSNRRAGDVPVGTKKLLGQ